MKGPIPFEGKLQSQATTYFRANSWRFPDYISADDLIQEAFLIYTKLAKRYADRNEAHFTATFMRSLVNYAVHSKWGLRRLTMVSENDINAPRLTTLLGTASTESAMDAISIKTGQFTAPNEYELLKLDTTDEERHAFAVLEANNFEMTRRKAYGKDGYESSSRSLERLTGVFISQERLTELLVGQ